MHAVMRNYSGKGTKALFDLLEKNKADAALAVEIAEIEWIEPVRARA
jgi:hypothetical protein